MGKNKKFHSFTLYGGAEFSNLYYAPETERKTRVIKHFLHIFVMSQL